MKTRSFIKRLLPFTASFLLAVGLTSAANRFAFKQSQGFTKEEARALVGRQVQSLCNASNIQTQETKGKVEFLRRDDWDEEIRLLIHWDYSMRGKHELISEDKRSFDKCTRVID